VARHAQLEKTIKGDGVANTFILKVCEATFVNRHTKRKTFVS
jgi:hypothetical protein